jgi:hypothetical protein
MTDRRDEWWPPKVVWAREFGWMNVRDPWTGEWHSIRGDEAPHGYRWLAQQAKLDGSWKR